MEQIKDRVAVIAGANTIGEAIAYRFAERGARLAICDSDANRVNKL